MPLAIFKPKPDHTKKIIKDEVKLSKMMFNVYKLNHRPKPKKRNRIKIVSCFSEFGCETIGCLYCIPRLLRRYPGSYVIAMGWYGREYLYRHLVDEYWELKEENMWLREYTRAFHSISDNLKRLEEAAVVHGDVVPAAALGKYAVSNYCRTCGAYWNEWRVRSDECPHCKSTVLVKSIFTDIKENKPTARKIPKPRQEYLDWAKDLLKPNTVGVFARGRETYGRNLQPEFYVKLIQILEEMGHNVIWLGEKQSTQACPVDHVLDYSRMKESQELERTLAIVCNLDFTIQFWTASSRLSSMMGTPFILFESPEQIYVSSSGLCGAQEGKRLELASFGPKKLVMAHYKNVYEDPDKALELVKRAAEELKEGNEEDILGMVEDEWFTGVLKAEHEEWLT